MEYIKITLVIFNYVFGGFAVYWLLKQASKNVSESFYLVIYIFLFFSQFNEGELNEGIQI